MQSFLHAETSADDRLHPLDVEVLLRVCGLRPSGPPAAEFSRLGANTRQKSEGQRRTRLKIIATEDDAEPVPEMQRDALPFSFCIIQRLKHRGKSP